MKLNLTDSERSRLGSANLDAFFAHINSSINDPNAIYQIPNGAMVTFQTGDAWVDQQNDLLAAQMTAKGENTCQISVPVQVTQQVEVPPDKTPSHHRISLTFPDGRQVTFNTTLILARSQVCQLTNLTINQIRSLEREKVVVPELTADSSGRKGKLYTFAQLLQLQGYKNMSDGKQNPLKSLKPYLLRKVLLFYKNHFSKGGIYNYRPLSLGNQVLIYNDDAMQFFDEHLHPVYKKGDMAAVIKSLDWLNQKQFTVTIHPSLLEVLLQLAENAWTIAELRERLLIAV